MRRLPIMKNVIKCLFHLRIVDFYMIFRKITQKRDVAILMYHRVIEVNADNVYDTGVVSTDPEHFKQQMRYLSRRCNVITFSQLAHYSQNNKKPPSNSVIITFDDGYRDIFINAYPILRGYKLPATIFLATGYINNPDLPWFDAVAYMVNKSNGSAPAGAGLGKYNVCDRKCLIYRLQEQLKKLPDHKKNQSISRLKNKLGIRLPSANDLFLSWSEIKEMSRHNISFGAHTVSHPILTRIGKKRANEEIFNSKNDIEENTDKRVIAFAYPNGQKNDINNKIDRFLKSQGILFSLTTIYGTNNMKSSMFRLKRIGIQYNDDMDIFRFKLSGFGQSFISYLTRWLP